MPFLLQATHVTARTCSLTATSFTRLFATHDLIRITGSFDDIARVYSIDARSPVESLLPDFAASDCVGFRATDQTQRACCEHWK